MSKMKKSSSGTSRPARFREIAAAFLKRPQMLRIKPSVSLFFLRYMRKFKIRSVGGRLIVHSHLPPLNGPAYGRFVREHILSRREGPSHAQIALTNACPQRCGYCYNRDRTGTPLQTPEILEAIASLRAAGVCWLGLTGGEPLLQKDLLKIVETAADGCAVKLFTTGMTLTRERAAELVKAGLFSVSISLDDWREPRHDAARSYPGAYRAALAAIRTCLETPGLDTGVSAVLSPEVIAGDRIEEFLEFLAGLGVHEAWLSEAKPAAAGTAGAAFAESDRLKIVALQDRWNRRGPMTVNYLGHFEGREHFGCNAGRKMAYIDPFGDVSPCVFTPLVLGNIRAQPLEAILRDMGRRFPAEESCFSHRNHHLYAKYARGARVLGRPQTLELLGEVEFGPLSEFDRRFRGKAASPALADGSEING